MGSLEAKTNEWYTPLLYVQMAREVLGDIELDPASCLLANQVVGANRIFTEEEDGLAQEWNAKTLFLNPPYGVNNAAPGKMADWINKLIAEYEAGHTLEAILLVNALPDRKWFQPLYNYPICFLSKRIRFYNSLGTPGSPQYGNAFVYLGSDEQRFIDVFSRYGAIVRRVAYKVA